MDILTNLAPALFLIAAGLMAIVGVRSQQGNRTPRRITFYAIGLSLLGLIGILFPDL
jgi:uncharacterized membrane protein